MFQNNTVAAVIVAAGSSVRMGFDKLLAQVHGRAVVLHTVAAFAACEAMDEIILVTGKNRSAIEQLLPPLSKPVTVVDGGATRADSVRCGVQATQADYIAIHDAARPFVSQDVILRTLKAAVQCGAAAPAVPVKDTIKQAGEDGIITATPLRSTLYAVQTPQIFAAEVYRNAMNKVQDNTVTDDCSVVEQAGGTVQLVQGDYANYKITTQEDLREERAMRIGHGYDVHKLTPGRKLILGGVDIPHTQGLLGHSDADVLVHAVMDALLGAAALGDIGQHFPDTDAQYKGADSIALLRCVALLLQQSGYTVQNIDATVLAQAPKLAPHIPSMRQNIAAALGIAVQCVSVKATTEEGLGFTGEKQGIAAHCVALLQ